MVGYAPSLSSTPKWIRIGLLLLIFLSLNSFLLLASSMLQLDQPKFGSDRRSILSISSSLWQKNDKVLPTHLEDNIIGKAHKTLSHYCVQPIDLVYTWVNGSDPEQLENEQDTEYGNRFEDHDELLYSLRSVFQYAPWIRNIYIVTNGQVPSWLDVKHPKIHLVTHESIFLNASHLPTFASPSIESNLHRIPHLSNHYLYLNDDTMFGQEVFPEDFYTLSRGQKVFLSWPVPGCAEGCSSSWLGDGFCDSSCNNEACNFDMGDCDNIKDSVQRTTCSNDCLIEWIADGSCDTYCNHRMCGFDGGDCGHTTIFEKLHGFEIDMNGTYIHVPEDNDYMSVYFNYSRFQEPILSVYHDNPEMILSAVHLKASQSVVLVFQFHTKPLNATVFLQRSDLTTWFEFTIGSSNRTLALPLLTMDKTSQRSVNASMDPYGESLKFVNSLLNTAFGMEQRFVPSHMPFYIQKDILERMHQLWQKEMDKTSSNRFRSMDDVQFSLSYFYFLMNERLPYSLDSLWRDTDRNNDGYLDEFEIRLMNATLIRMNIPMHIPDISSELNRLDFDMSFSCDLNSEKIHLNDLIGRSIDEITQCQGLLTLLEEVFKEQRRNRFETLTSPEDVGFLMVTNNKTVLRDKLNHILSRKYKFLCLNDNINYTNDDTHDILEEMKSFFNLMYPLKSPFELEEKEGIRRYTHVREILKDQEMVHYRKSMIALLVFIGVLILCSMILFY